MKALMRTNDPTVISFACALLNDAGIEALVMDENVSVLEGSIGIIPRRIMISDDDLWRARRLMVDAELGHELMAEESH